MNAQVRTIYVGDSPIRGRTGRVEGGYAEMLGETYHCIRAYDQMPPFFMSVVSSSDHWMFISSTGGLSAGRANAESALFPYTTDDKLSENSDNTGHVAVVLATKGDRTLLWEPFRSGCPGLYEIERNLYKNLYGDKLIFEEINHDLALRYCYAWRTSDKFGFVMTAWIENLSIEPWDVALVSGLQNLLPYGATTALQTTFSNLLNGYKHNELEPETGLGIFGLSSTLTDLAEPSESLKATTVWQTGLEGVRHLLSTRQLDDFRYGRPITQETDMRGYRGAYLVNTTFELGGGEQKRWYIVAEVNQDAGRVATLINVLNWGRSVDGPADTLADRLEVDVAEGTEALVAIVAASDGLQLSADRATTTHHLSNTLFNVMRGGIFVDGYGVDTVDFVDFVGVRNRRLLREQAGFFAELPDHVDHSALLTRAVAAGSQDLVRLCYAYLPLTFSRRHGDPSRPWNKFSINLKKPDGSRKLDYQGNWRDIFQNWEPLAWSYPEFIEGMISTFLNATTADGYNPYRVTRDGIEWEAPSPDDPWANIGYWSDHQIIYLQKLLEISAKFHPGRLESLLSERVFSHANVPYRIKPYSALVEDWYDTIEFDRELDGRIAGIVREIGTDGKLLQAADGGVFHVNLAEKLLILLLAKLGNFVPEGGIWMNTQRPEWNDANNALVGKGLSIVTLAYLRRYVVFFRELLTDTGAVEITSETLELLEDVRDCLDAHASALEVPLSDGARRAVMDALGQASSDYRWKLYEGGLSGEFAALDAASLVAFLDLVQRYTEHTLRANRRPDGLYHAYNVLRLGKDTASVDHLYEMLEGQVAILSSGMLSGEEALALLRALRHSRMYRADQHTYMLYPDKDLPGFLRKNVIPADRVAESALVARLVADGDRTLIARDENGVYHFNGDFRNAKDARQALDALATQEAYADLVEAEAGDILQLFEDVFDHSSFTGRSGTFFAYEGLGSIYWHMVAKLLLAAQEAFLTLSPSGGEPEGASGRGATVAALAESYYDIREGLGFNKTPEVFGAFPTDPYSHTPAGQGAKQPGMTGLVKEEILTRMGELGIVVEDGVVAFEPRLLRAAEFLGDPTPFTYIDVDGSQQVIDLPANSLAFTFCQVPVIYIADNGGQTEVSFSDGATGTLPGNTLDDVLSAHIFRRDGHVRCLTVHTQPRR